MPLGRIRSRPLSPPQRATGMKTTLAGRNPFGRINGSLFVPFVQMAPLKRTIPEKLRTAAFADPRGAFIQPFWSFSGVKDVDVSANEAPSSEVPHWTAQSSLF